ncbi:MAG: prenyltransferase, partial [Anaerolineales bacterium]
ESGLPEKRMGTKGDLEMNFAMWNKALKVIPNVSREEWNHLDFISKWLISTRAAVLVMTLISALLAGLFAIRDNLFQPLPWLALAFGLIMAHASNNLFNDYTDYVRGIDQKNYYRAMYGPQPLVDGLMTRRQNLTYFVITAALALASGLYLAWYNNFDTLLWILLGLGAFFILFYTWPLKHMALGEVAVVIVWGPLMIGGGYYVLTHNWDWNVVWASLPYALGVTTVIFGKHIDKIEADKAKNIHTLPVLIGEKIARQMVIGMMVLPYFLLLYLVATKYFTPLILIVLIAIPRLRQVLPAFLKPKPATRPQDFPEGQGGWPLYFAPLAFGYNRSFGTLFVLGLIAEVLIRILLPTFWR